MVSETVVEPAVEQTADDSPQVEVVAPVEPETASPEADTPSVEEGAESEVVPEAKPETVTFTLAELEERDAEKATVERNAGAQQREAALRRELGNDEAVKARMVQYAAHVEQNGSDPAKLNQIIQDRDLFATDAARRALGNDVLSTYVTDPAERARQQATLERLNGDALGTEVGSLFNTAVNAAAAQRVADFGFADVPKDSTLYKGMKAAKDREVADELKAHGIEVKGSKSPAPAVPQSGTGNAGGPTAAEYKAASRAQRQQWRKENVEIRAE